MQSYYEINVSYNGFHLFATAERSIQTTERAAEVYNIFKEKFPSSEGYKITVTFWNAAGRLIDFGITKDQARAFYRDLCGTVYGDRNKTCQGIMSADLIGEHMGLTEKRAKEYCEAMVEHGITERQGGGYVV